MTVSQIDRKAGWLAQARRMATHIRNKTSDLAPSAMRN